MPANVVNARQTSETFRVYDPNDALGDVHPNQPRANDPQIAQPAPKKNKGCGGAGQILLAVVAIAVAAVVAQWAIPALAKTAIGQAIGGALGATGSTIGTGVAAGAAGSLVSQGVGVAVGLQDRIDWRGVALSAIAGGVGATPGLSSTSGGFVAQGVRGAAANALTQGIAIATGLQSKFDWTGVAVGAVVRGTRNAVSNVATGDSWSADLVNHATRGVVAGAAGAGVRSLIDGTSFERSFRAALPDIIGSTIGSVIAGGNQQQSAQVAKAAQDRATAARHANGDYLTESLDRAIQGMASGSRLNYGDDYGSSFGSTIGGGSAGNRFLQGGSGGDYVGAGSYQPVIGDPDFAVRSGSFDGGSYQVGNRPSVTVNGVTTVDEVVVTAQRRGVLGWLGEGLSDLAHGRFNEIGGDLAAAGRAGWRALTSPGANQFYNGFNYAQRYSQDYADARNAGLNTLRSGWQQLGQPGLYNGSDGIAANLNTLSGGLKVVGGGIAYAASPITGAVNTVVGRPLEMATGGALPREFAGNATLTIGSFFVGGPATGNQGAIGTLVRESAITDAKLAQTLALPKGARPDPATYLSPGFINQHLAQFEGGVTKFAASTPNGVVGPPGGTFVMPKAVADELISRAGSVADLERMLSLDAGALGKNPVRIDIPAPTGLRFSSGNELGANSQWRPGGYTGGNIPEATIDRVNPGSYTSHRIF